LRGDWIKLRNEELYLLTVLFTKYYEDDGIQERDKLEMRSVYKRLVMKGRNHLVDLDIDDRIILKMSLWYDDVDWAYLAQKWVLRLGLLNTVM
jgi:hypothetical protein